MILKFKVGDRVEIMSADLDSKKVIGEVGTIMAIDAECYNPYWIKYDNDELNQEAEAGWLQDLFSDEELMSLEKPVVKEINMKDIRQKIEDGISLSFDECKFLLLQVDRAIQGNRED